MLNELWLNWCVACLLNAKMKYIAKSKLLKLDDLIYLQKWTCLDQSSWLGHNVCRIYDTDAFDDFDPYQVVRCCNLEVFKPKVVTDSLLPENKHVFVSVIENCFEDCLSEVEIVEVGEDGAAAKIEMTRDRCQQWTTWLNKWLRSWKQWQNQIQIHVCCNSVMPGNKILVRLSVMPLLVKCYDNKKVKSLIGLTIYQLVGPRGGEPTKKSTRGWLSSVCLIPLWGF